MDHGKTQFRRIIKDATGAFWDHPLWSPIVEDGRVVRWENPTWGQQFFAGAPMPKCSFGKPGDRLYVREACALVTVDEYQQWKFGLDEPSYYAYRADDETKGQFVEDWRGWTPAVRMPRAAARIKLEVVSVRAERLQAISEADAIAEGVKRVRDACYVFPGFDYDLVGLCHNSPITPFAKLWDHLRGDGSWDDNRWVWVIEARVIPFVISQ